MAAKQLLPSLGGSSAVWITCLVFFQVMLLLGYLFAPFAWCMGIEAADCLKAGQLLGTRMISNEFIAYLQLGEWQQDGSQISERTQVLLTYALNSAAASVNQSTK